jgi:fido (protein-threonine AMPylation protein)
VCGESCSGEHPAVPEAFPGFASFRDEEDAPFFRSAVRPFDSPEATAIEIVRCFSRVIYVVMDEASSRPLRIGSDDLLRWHRATFRSTFPYQAGEIRRGEAWFGVRWREQGELHRSMVKGSDPDLIRDELHEAFRAYNGERARRGPERRPLADALRTTAELYTALLRIHPFEDGNLRAAFPVLQGALISLGAAPVHFEQAVAEHDEAIGWALRPETAQQTVEPFVDLLRARIEAAARSGWRPLR